MNNFKNLLYEEEKGIAKIIINRPQVINALNAETRQELKEALKHAEDNDSVKVVVIKGAGESFCAGADISKEYRALSPVQMRNWLQQWGITTITNVIATMGKPVIAAVDGYCLGASFEIAMACDITIASERAMFGQTEIKVGLIPGGGSTQRLPRLVGVKKAKELIFTGDIISAEEAEKLTLVNSIVPVEKLDEEVNNFAIKLMRRSPIMLRLAKTAINRTEETSLSTGLSFETELFLSGWGTEDRKEGQKAFFEKRKPIFKGY